MTDIDAQVREIFGRILRDIQVELGDEFDRNFERQAFFSEAWERRRSPLRPGAALLSGTGNSTLRKSVRSEIRDNSIVFIYSHQVAAIHNEGCEIKVTERMKRFFWHKYYSATGSFGRKKDGSRRNDKRSLQLSDEADFWKAMALMKVGSKIRIPQRKFLGTSPEVEAAVRQIIEENLNEYVNNIDFNIK